MNNKVSVCIATFNGEKYIYDQIISILPQLKATDEIIISDDNSEDDTVNIIKSINDSRIILLNHNSTGFYTSNFENALRYATGDIIFLSDQDDVWTTDKVEVCLKYLDKYDFVISDAKITDKELNIIIDSRNKYYNIKNGFWRNYIKSRYLGCCMAFKRNVLEEALPFPKNHDLCHHDTWISLIAEMSFKTYIINEQLIMYRRHDENTSTGGTTRSSLKKIIRIRLYLICCLILRKLRIHYNKNDRY